MRKFLTTNDIARLARRSRAQIWSLAKLDRIPGQRVKYCGRRFRYLDSPEIRLLCEIKRRRLNDNELALLAIEGLVRAVIERDYLADFEKFKKFMLREFRAQLRESTDPEQLVEKWKRAIAHR